MIQRPGLEPAFYLGLAIGLGLIAIASGAAYLIAAMLA